MGNRITRHKRIRAKIKGTSAVPRISVFKSNKHMYLQAIDDEKQITIASLALPAEKIDSFVKKLKEGKINKIVFDRGGYKYHGKIKEIAESLRAAGLEF